MLHKKTLLEIHQTLGNDLIKRTQNTFVSSSDGHFLTTALNLPLFSDCVGKNQGCRVLCLSLYTASKPWDGKCVSWVLVSKVKKYFLVVLKVISFSCVSHRRQFYFYIVQQCIALYLVKNIKSNCQHSKSSEKHQSSSYLSFACSFICLFSMKYLFFHVHCYLNNLIVMFFPPVLSV